VIADDDTGHTLASTVSVEGVTLFFDVLPLAWGGTLGDGLGEERHELADGCACEAGVGGQVALSAELNGGLALILEDLLG